MKRNLKEVAGAVILCIFMFQPANDSSSQSSTPKQDQRVPSNDELKKRVDAKAEQYKKSVEETAEKVDDKIKSRTVYRVRWRTQVIHDTVWKNPADTTDFEPEPIVIVCDTVHDTIRLRPKSLLRRLF